jgi:hypothetical protein
MTKYVCRVSLSEFPDLKRAWRRYEIASRDALHAVYDNTLGITTAPDQTRCVELMYTANLALQEMLTLLYRHGKVDPKHRNLDGKCFLYEKDGNVFFCKKS